MNNDAFGASTGKVGDLSSQGLINDFNDISNNDVTGLLGTDRVQPRDISPGTMRGTLRIANNDGSYITIGEIPGQTGSDGKPQFGFGFFDANGNLKSKELGESLVFSNGTVTTTITASAFTQNDGTNDRLFLGDE